MKISTRTLALGTAAAALYAAVSSSRNSRQTGRYLVRRSNGPFELRDYPLLRVASSESPEEDRDSSIRRLLRFVQAGRAQRPGIPMTTPAPIESTGATTGDDGQETSSSAAPETRATRGVTLPMAGRVTAGERPADTVAVYRFSGRASNRRERRAIDTLRKWIEREGFETMGPATVAYHDASWLPGPLRRNEVMFRVAQASQRSATAGSTRDARLAGR